jgi:hypothetical protein
MLNPSEGRWQSTTRATIGQPTRPSSGQRLNWSSSRTAQMRIQIADLGRTGLAILSAHTSRPKVISILDLVQADAARRPEEVIASTLCVMHLAARCVIHPNDVLVKSAGWSIRRGASHLETEATDCVHMLYDLRLNVRRPAVPRSWPWPGRRAVPSAWGVAGGGVSLSDSLRQCLMCLEHDQGSGCRPGYRARGQGTRGRMAVHSWQPTMGCEEGMGI